MEIKNSIETKKIADLPITNEWKKALAITVKGATIAQIAAKTYIPYTTVSQRMAVYAARKWVVKRKVGNKNVYILNDSKIST